MRMIHDAVMIAMLMEIVTREHIQYDGGNGIDNDDDSPDYDDNYVDEDNI